MIFSQTSAYALNHLLSQNSWAGPRLARFFGKTIRFDIVPFSVVLKVSADGMLRPADDGASADARCVVAPSLLPRLALQEENAFQQITTEGDSALLAEIFFLARNLRWDAAEDLSKVTGDIAAERIVQTAGSVKQQVGDAAVNFARAAAEYWTEERPLIAKPEQLREFTRQVDILRDDIARMEQRVKRLSDSKKT